MQNLLLQTAFVSLGLLYGSTLVAATDNDDEKKPNHPVSQREKDPDATPGDIKKFFGKVEGAKEKTEERVEKAKPALKEAGKEIEHAAKDTGKAVEKFFSGVAGHRDDKKN